jgi:hypothetical protein
MSCGGQMLVGVSLVAEWVEGIAYWVVAIQTPRWDLRTSSSAQLGAFPSGDNLALAFAHCCGDTVVLTRERL